ncbi:MAG TPA: alpha/beta hydrolase [Methylovirgula sp.]|nr:alpha/beta hydrolase [Methylovirgula sp.]
MSANSSTLQLRDGRTLGLAEYGDPAGNVLFYFHGYPGARVEARLLAEPAQRLGIRLIGIDRPGMGLSTFQARRRFLDWPSDVAGLADKLGIDRFSVVGCSGGGPYALACACKIPDRLVACGIVAGAGIAGPFLSLISRGLPWLLSPLIRPFFQDEEHAARSGRRFNGWWPEPDKKVRPRVGNILAASLVEAFRQGSKGLAYEGTLLGGHWDFKPEDVHCPNLYWWHGERDRHVPIAMGRAVADRLSGCKAIYYPDEGHISLIVNRGEDIVRTLTKRSY